MIGKFVETMMTGTNGDKLVVIATAHDGKNVVVMALKHSMLMIEGEYSYAGTEFKHKSPLSPDKAVRWDFDKDFDLFKSPRIVMDGTANEMVFIKEDGSETSVFGTDNNADTFKSVNQRIKSSKKGLVGGAEWKAGKFEVLPEVLMIVNKENNLEAMTDEGLSYIEPSLFAGFLEAITPGAAFQVSLNVKNALYVIKLADNIQLVEKPMLYTKGTPKMSDQKPEPAVQAQPTATAAPPAPPVVAQPPPQAASTLNGAKPPAPADKEPDIDDAMNALASLDDIAAAIKAQSRIIRHVFKAVSKKAPGKDLEIKYNELKKKLETLKAAL